MSNKFGDLYLEWASKMNAFIPKVKNLKKSNFSFSFRNVLKKGYTSFFGIIAFFTFLEVGFLIFNIGKLELDLEWAFFLLSLR